MGTDEWTLQFSILAFSKLKFLICVGGIGEHCYCIAFLFVESICVRFLRHRRQLLKVQLLNLFQSLVDSILTIQHI